MLQHDSYARSDITESERGNDVSNPTGGQWSLVAPTAKLYQKYLKAWLDPNAHTKHNRDNSCYSDCQDYYVDAGAGAAGGGAAGTTADDDGFISSSSSSSQDHYVRAWEKLSERENLRNNEINDQHQQH